MQGTMPGARRRGRPRTAWMDNIKTWTGLPVEESVRMTKDGDKWSKYVHGVASSRIKDGWRTEQLGLYQTDKSICTTRYCRNVDDRCQFIAELVMWITDNVACWRRTIWSSVIRLQVTTVRQRWWWKSPMQLIQTLTSPSQLHLPIIHVSFVFIFLFQFPVYFYEHSTREVSVLPAISHRPRTLHRHFFMSCPFEMAK